MSIISLLAPDKMTTTMQNENGTDSNDIKGTHHSLSQPDQHNI